MKTSPSSKTHFQKISGSQSSQTSSKPTLVDPAPSLAARFPKPTLPPIEISEDETDYSDVVDDVSDTTDLTVDEDRTRDSCTPATPRTPRAPLTPPTRSAVKFKPSSPCITRRAAGETSVDAIEASSKPPVSSTRSSTKPQTLKGRKSKETGSSSLPYAKPLTKKDLEFIIPHEISARLSETRTKCIATMVKDGVTRCPSNAKGSPRGYPIAPSLQALGEAYSQRNYTTIVACIKEFCSIAMCGNHYKGGKSPRIKKLEDFVSTLQAKNAPEEEEEAKDFHAWLKQLSNASYHTSTSTPDDGSRDRHCDVSGSTRRSARRSTHSDAPVLSGETGALPQNNTKVSTTANPIQFQRYQPKNTKNISTPEAISRVLKREFTEKGDGSGFIYLFRDAGESGHIKIGQSEHIVERLQSWVRDCQRDYEFCNPSLNGKLDKVPHANRVEKLMQAELKELRRSTECEPCEQSHREWFEVDELHAVAVFKKWERWIKTRPYKKCADGKWRLSDSAKKGLDALCEPLDFAGKDANEPKKNARPHKRVS